MVNFKIGQKVKIDNTNGQAHNPDYEITHCIVHSIPNDESNTIECTTTYKHKRTRETVNQHSFFRCHHIIPLNQDLDKLKESIQW